MKKEIVNEISKRIRSCRHCCSQSLAIALMIGMWALLATAPARADQRLVDPEFWKEATVEQIETIVSEGTDIHVQEPEYLWTPLHLAAGFAKDPAIIALLLTNGASIDAQDRDGAQPLHIAAGFSSRDSIVSMLLNRGASIDTQDKNGFTPLHWAAANATNAVTASLLISRGADLEAVSNVGFTPLLAAANFSKSEELLRLFYQKGGNVLAKAGGLGIEEMLDKNADLGATETGLLIRERVAEAAVASDENGG